jgi:hypothetical protein
LIQSLEVAKRQEEKALDCGHPPHQFRWLPLERTFEKWLMQIELFDWSLMIVNESKTKGARVEDPSEAQVLEEIPRLTGESPGHGQVAADQKIKISVSRERTVSADAQRQLKGARTRTFQIIVLLNLNGRLYQSKP